MYGYRVLPEAVVFLNDLLVAADSAQLESGICRVNRLMERYGFRSRASHRWIETVIADVVNIFKSGGRT